MHCREEIKLNDKATFAHGGEEYKKGKEGLNYRGGGRCFGVWGGNIEGGGSGGGGGGVRGGGEKGKVFV